MKLVKVCNEFYFSPSSLFYLLLLLAYLVIVSPLASYMLSKPAA